MIPSGCSGGDRRHFLKVGTVGGLSMAEVLRLQTACANGAQQKDLNCIFIFIVGGMPQQDMWDLKPNAPAEIRGDFEPIETTCFGPGGFYEMSEMEGIWIFFSKNFFTDKPVCTSVHM